MTSVARTSVHSDINAILQPFVNPGSIPRIRWPLSGDSNSNCFKFVAKTSIEAFSADFVNSFRTRRVINGCTGMVKFGIKNHVFSHSVQANYVSSKCIH